MHCIADRIRVNGIFFKLWHFRDLYNQYDHFLKIFFGGTLPLRQSKLFSSTELCCVLSQLCLFKVKCYDPECLKDEKIIFCQPFICVSLAGNGSSKFCSIKKSLGLTYAWLLAIAASYSFLGLVFANEFRILPGNIWIHSGHLSVIFLTIYLLWILWKKWLKELLLNKVIVKHFNH